MAIFNSYVTNYQRVMLFANSNDCNGNISDIHVRCWEKIWLGNKALHNGLSNKNIHPPVMCYLELWKIIHI